MLLLTTDWSEDMFRGAIRKLDEKTGLDGAKLDIQLFEGGRRLGYYRRGVPGTFGFNLSFFNSLTVNAAEKLDVIRHEYAHYYDFVTKLDTFIVRSKREKVHGADWKFACRMLNANPRSRHNSALFKDINWSAEDIEARYNAEDVRKLDIRSYLKRWNQVPLDEEKTQKIIACIKKKNLNGYYDIGDIILHPLRGYGTVLDAIPCVELRQKVYVRFDDQTEGIFISEDLWKFVDGVAVPYCRR